MNKEDKINFPVNGIVIILLYSYVYQFFQWCSHSLLRSSSSSSHYYICDIFTIHERWTTLLHKVPIVSLHDLPTTGSGMDTGMVIIIFCINIITYRNSIFIIWDVWTLTIIPTAQHFNSSYTVVQWTNFLTSEWFVRPCRIYDHNVPVQWTSLSIICTCTCHHHNLWCLQMMESYMLMFKMQNKNKTLLSVVIQLL